jgi:hypothetical protein
VTPRPKDMWLGGAEFGLQQVTGEGRGERYLGCGGDQSCGSEVSMRNATAKRVILTMWNESRWSARLDRELPSTSAVFVSTSTPIGNSRPSLTFHLNNEYRNAPCNLISQALCSHGNLHTGPLDRRDNNCYG